MTLRFMTIEDMGTRTRDLRRLCTFANEAARSVATGPSASTADFAKLDQADEFYHPESVRVLGPADLAEIDAVFIDFDLQSHKVSGNSLWQPFVLRDGTQVRPNTGISCLLYLTDLIQTKEYCQTRTLHLAKQPVQHRLWCGQRRINGRFTGPGTTRLFSFVEAKDPVSMLYAAAAATWFDADYFNAQPNLDDHDECDAAIKALLMRREDWLTWVPVARFYADQAPAALNALLVDSDFRTGSPKFIPPDQWPHNFDFYRIYLEHRGKSGFGTMAEPTGFRDALHTVTGLATAGQVNHDSTQAVYEKALTALDDFRQEVDFNADAWPAWHGLKSPDPMYEYLQQSALFWTSQDVRQAFERYRAQRKNP